MEQTMIKVLWVDDDPALLKELPREAHGFGLYLEGHECWEEAERALLANFYDYDAIILDAKCKFKKDDDPRAPRFLTNALNRLADIGARNKRTIQWYVLSMGGGEVGDISENIPDSRKEWDGDWENDERNPEHRPYYLKNIDDKQALFSRIKEQYNPSDRTQIKTILYPDVFRAIDACKLDSDVSKLLVDLLMPIHFPCSEGVNEKHLTYAIRKIIDCTFRAMIEEWHLMPSELIQKKQVKLSPSSHCLLGNDVWINNNLIMEEGMPITDKITGLNIKNMIDVVGNYVHSKNEEDLSLTKNLSEHFEKVANTTYLIRSYALQICDFLMQLEGIVQNNPNKDENAKKWKVS